MRAMRVQWATNEKAMMASNKHFNGAFNVTQMTTVATAMIKRADMVGTSDRSNGNYAPAKIVWATFNGTKYAAVLDSKDIKKGIATIISFLISLLSNKAPPNTPNTCLLYTSPSPRDS